jgi:hypothetical protein
MLYIKRIHNMYQDLLQYLIFQGQQKSTFVSFRADAYLIGFLAFLCFVPFKNVTF